MSRALQGSQDVRFLPGIREDINPHDAPPGTLVDAMNVRYGRLGGIRARRGTRALAIETALGSGNMESTTRPDPPGFIARVDDVRVMGKDGIVWAYGETEWMLQGSYSTCQPRQRRNGLTTEGGGGFSRPDTRSAIASIENDSGDFLMVAATDGTSVYWRVETFEGTVLREGAFTGTVCNIVAQGDYFVLIVQDGASLNAYTILTQAGPSVFTDSVATLLGTLFTTSSHWDATAYDDESWYLVYRLSADNFRFSRRELVTQNGSALLTNYATGNSQVSVWGDTTNGLIWIGYYLDPSVVGQVGYLVYNTAVSNVGSGTIVTATNIYGPPLFGPPASRTLLTAFWVHRRANSSGSPYTWATHYGTADTAGTVTRGGVGAVGAPIWHVAPLTKPDAKQRVWCEITDSAAVLVSGGEHGFRTSRHVLLKFPETVSSPQFPVLELANDPMENQSSGPSAHEFHVIASASDRHFTALPQLIRSGNLLLFRCDVLEYETSDQVPQRRTCGLSQSTAVTGQPVEMFGHAYPFFGTTSNWFSGSAEIGFPYEPAVFAAAASNGAGSLTVSSSYRYIFVYEWIDQYGRRHQSGASKVVTVATGASDDTVTFTLAALSFGQRLAYSSAVGSVVMPPVIHAYRTIAGSSGPYRRATPGTGAPVAWDDSDGTVSWVDTLSDALLASQEILYTDGGVVNNALAPSARHVAASDERVALAGLWDRNIVRTSKIIVPGEPVLFTNSAAFDVVLRSPCTGIAYQDGQLVAFEKSGISVIYGDGPNDQGNGSFLARRIASDRGCVEGRSVLETALGIIFLSHRGFELLPRGNGAPQFIGAPIQELTRTYPTCIGAALYTSGSERLAMFLMGNGETPITGSTTLIFCLDLDMTAQLGYGVWSYDDIPTAALSAIGEWPEGVALLKRTPLSLAGVVYDRDYTDGYDYTDTAPLTVAVETAEIRLAGLAGWWRCCSMVSLLTDCDGGTLTLTATTDGTDTTTSTAETRTLPSTSKPVYHELVPSAQLCSAATLRASVVIGDTGVTGPTFHGFTLEAAPQPGARRTSSGER